jgi:hypothetical protein
VASAGRGVSAFRATLIGLGVSALVELTQWSALPGRGAAAADLVANAVGSGVGAWLVASWRPADRTRATPWLATAVIAVLIALPTASRWLLQPTPSGREWFGQPAPQLAGFEPYGGALRQAELDGAPLLAGPLPGTGRHRTTMHDQRSTLIASVDPGAAAVGASVIAQVADEAQESQLTLGEDRLGYWATVRTRASAWGFRSPVARMPRGTASGAQRVIVRLEAARLELLVEDNDGTRTTAVPWGMTTLWQVVTPTSRFAGWNRAIGHIAVFSLAALLLLATPAIWSGTWGLAIAAGAVAGGAFAGEPWSVVLVYAAGAAAGVLLSPVVRQASGVTRPARR